MKITKTMKRKEFAAAVVNQLEKHGISCVLVGGACVSIYTDEKLKVKDTTIMMDRLAAWFHWNDRRSLIHALWVCEQHPVKNMKTSFKSIRS